MLRRRGPLAILLAAVSAHALRIVGLTMVCLSAAVMAGSLTTDHGLAAPETAAATATATSGVSATLLFEFATAHPAYPVAMFVGLFLIVSGEDTPLLGS